MVMDDENPLTVGKISAFNGIRTLVNSIES